MTDLEAITKETIHGYMQEHMPNLILLVKAGIRDGLNKHQIQHIIKSLFSKNEPILNNMLLELDYLWENR